MDCNSTQLPYGDTGYFTPIVLDYINRSEKLDPFYRHAATIEGISNAIKEKEKSPVNRALLVNELKRQYSALPDSSRVLENIALA